MSASYQDYAMKTERSRRSFFKACFSTVLTMCGAATLLVSCESPANKSNNEKAAKADSEDACAESALTAEDQKARDALGFVKTSPEKNKHCGNCKLYLPPPAGQECSKCQLFKGTVPATAYCTYWAAQA